MGLVDYSESSGSESEAPAKPNPKPTHNSKKPAFQKVVDRSNPGKILVNLPQIKPEEPKTRSDEPPAKRVRTGGGGAFSGFGSFLPAPKNAAKTSAPAASSSSRPVFSLKTGAAPGFSRDNDDQGESAFGDASSGFNLPPPKAQAQPEIPADMKPAEEVKLVGKPLMFRPLSVARKPGKKTGAKASAMKAAAATDSSAQQPEAQRPTGLEPKEPVARKKISLFSISNEPEETAQPSPASGAYEPMFAEEAPEEAVEQYVSYVAPAAPSSNIESLDTVADDLNLSAAARRELFGRQKAGGPKSAAKVINFNTDQEYQHNEDLRAAGEKQTHNPVRAIAPGKHNLRQLVNQVQSQREALEESFAKGRTNRKEASSRYGW